MTAAFIHMFVDCTRFWFKRLGYYRYGLIDFAVTATMRRIAGAILVVVRIMDMWTAHARTPR
jgi:hypothetical protein